MTSPRDWHESANPRFFRAGEEAESDFEGWEVRESLKGPLLHTPRAQASVTALATVMQPPARWNDDPRSALTVQLSSEQLLAWLWRLEQWALPKITGREEPRSVVRENLFGERYVRCKITGVSRFYDAYGSQLTDMPCYYPECPVCVLVHVSVYRMNGSKGLSVRLLAAQAMK